METYGPAAQSKYIDELVQESVNTNYTTDSTCETKYWACCDANYNVLGLVNASGVLTERYEYTPYGQRKVFVSSGSSDAGCYAPLLASQRVSALLAAEPWGLCEFGHQGLMHDEETGLVYNRARMLHPGMGRFMQRDPIGYPDGMNFYEYAKSNSTVNRDAKGLHIPDDERPFGSNIHSNGKVDSKWSYAPSGTLAVNLSWPGGGEYNTGAIVSHSSGNADFIQIVRIRESGEGGLYWLRRLRDHPTNEWLIDAERSEGGVSYPGKGGLPGVMTDSPGVTNNVVTKYYYQEFETCAKRD